MSQVVYKSLGYLGFPNYRVGDDGSFWSCHKYLGNSKYGIGPWKQVVVRPVSKKVRYLRVRLSEKTRIKHFLLHRLVLTSFVGPCPEGMQGCHNNGNPLDNRLTNLRWDTIIENQADRLLHGTDILGEKNVRAILTDQQGRDIITKHQLDGFGMSFRAYSRKYASMYGVNEQYLFNVIRRKGRWARV